MSRSLIAATLGGIIFTTSLFSTGCATSRAQAVGTPDAATVAAFDRLKTLAGTWEMADDKGQKSVAAVYSVTSNGSTVREIMFPGADHEMTNMYHLDGSSIMMTHYCAMGNQPRMRCLRADGSTFNFTFDGITNMASKDDNPMASMVLEIKDADHVTQSWSNLRTDPQHAPVFELSRKR
jgi:hypothetical protein